MSKEHRSKEGTLMIDEYIQTESLETETTASAKGSLSSSLRSNEAMGNKQVLKPGFSHQKAQEYLEEHFESVDYELIKKVHKSLDKAIYSVSHIKDNIAKAIQETQESFKSEGEENKKVAILELLESFYNKYGLVDQEEDLEETFSEALSVVLNSSKDKELEGFIQDVYPDYFE